MTADERRDRYNRYLDLLTAAHRQLHPDDRRDDLANLWTELMDYAAPEHREAFARGIERLTALMIGRLNLESWLSFQNGFNSAALDRPAAAPPNPNTRTQ